MRQARQRLLEAQPGKPAASVVVVECMVAWATTTYHEVVRDAVLAGLGYGLSERLRHGQLLLVQLLQQVRQVAAVLHFEHVLRLRAANATSGHCNLNRRWAVGQIEI